MNRYKLIIEADDGGQLWGRTSVDDNLIVEASKTQEALEAQIKQLIKELHGIEPDTIEFEVEYDLEAFFQKFDFLKITGIARESEINESLMRQYATGKKYPAKKQVERIEAAIRKLGESLSKITLATTAQV